jgi:hypothetical protein
MTSVLRLTLAGTLLTIAAAAVAQNKQPTTVPQSINFVWFVWKDVERDFVSLAEAMPEDKWSFRPTQGVFSNVRTFAEQVKRVACANEAWAKQMEGKKPPEGCDLGGPNPAKSKAEILAIFATPLRSSIARSRIHLVRTCCTPSPARTGGPIVFRP